MLGHLSVTLGLTYKIMKIVCHDARTGVEFDAELKITTDIEFSLKMVFDDLEFIGVGADLIDALRHLRLNFLEPIGISILVNGCRRDFVASRMQRQSTGGKVGFILVMGKASRRENSILTFDPALLKAIALVAEQDIYYKYWLESLRK